MAILTMLNQKGGVGKSTTTFHLGGTLAKRGMRVLIVDNDPQSSISQGIVGPLATSALDPGETIAALYRGDPVVPASLVRTTDFPGLDFIAGSEYAGEYNRPHPHSQPWQLQESLVEALRELSGDYGMILIDCPPTLQLASWAALAASDGIIVPLQAEDYGSQGLAAVNRSIELVRATVNPDLRVIGYLLTMFGKTILHAQYAGVLRETYGSMVFEATIPSVIGVPEATAARKPIAFHKPRSVGSKAFAALADELLARLESASPVVEAA
jgi:chromosome partitioning protein